MKLKKLIGQKVIRTKPKSLPGGNKNFWDFSFMSSAIEIIDVGHNFIFYKEIYPKNSWMHKVFSYDFIHQIKTLDIKDDDGNWTKYQEEDKELYLKNCQKWHDFYEKNYPNEIRLMQQAY